MEPLDMSRKILMNAMYKIETDSLEWPKGRVDRIFLFSLVFQEFPKGQA